MYNRPVRILLLNLYYPPDTSATARMAQTVAQALGQQHQVTVLCGRPSYDPVERRPWRLWQTEHSGNVRIVRVGSTAFPRFNMKMRILNYLTYMKLAVPVALFIPCDLVVAMTDPPFEGIVGAWVSLLKFKSYLYNIRDMYPDMAVGGSIVKPGLVSRVWERLHRWALRRAAKIVVLGEDMKARIAGKRVESSRIEIVRDGAEIPPPGAPPPQLDADVIRAIRGEFRFVLLHAGNLGFYGAWDTLLAAAPQLASQGIAIVFVGDGAERPRIEAAAKNIPNVRLLPFFPANKIPSVLAAADVHIITVSNGLEGVVVPSKMYAILAAAKPILAVTPRACEPVILGEPAGYTRWAPAGDPGAVADAALELFLNPSEIHRMEEAALAAAPSYDRVKELQKFTQIVASLNPANKK